MSRHRVRGWWWGWAVAAAGLVGSVPMPASAQVFDPTQGAGPGIGPIGPGGNPGQGFGPGQDPTLGQNNGPGPGPGQAFGPQPLTRGPMHEAFAEPVVYDPRPGPVVPKAPPPPVREVPPALRPEGVNVEWIPGYWAWDDGRNDFLWVSGLWRDVPPGRQWVPGYWSQAQGGFAWVPGAWVAAGLTQLDYLPQPPDSLEGGPNSPPPAPDSVWSPGCWCWQDGQYLWQPGFWVPYQSNWVWVPAQNYWSPGGNFYANGYWDRPLAQRGSLFAPVYFNQPYAQPAGFAFTPTVGLLASALATSLFVRPSFHQYYFGDYYAANNFQSGIYPWYSFHNSRYGYDPLYSHYAASNLNRNPGWVDPLPDQYRGLRDHPEFRPPHNFGDYQRFQAGPNFANAFNGGGLGNALGALGGGFGGGGGLGRNLPLAGVYDRIASEGVAGPRFAAVDESRRLELARQSERLGEYRDQRVRQEVAAARERPASNGVENRQAAFAHRAELSRSPIAAPERHDLEAYRPPPAPQHPALEREARPRAAGEPALRHEPHPEFRPPAGPRIEEHRGRR